ncbi:MAG: hypothetical protein GF409_03465 [Candidatus Omnitrophica bacterium]|nr:hypothetical protein [Candidatus Omnitrophota bacterium]
MAEEKEWHEDIILDGEKKIPLDALEEKVRVSAEDYFIWWHNQKMSLLAFLVLLVISIFWVWWLLIPAFLLLGYNLFANFQRLMALKKIHEAEEE